MSHNLPALPKEIVEKLITEGDLSGLSPEQRVEYYARLCERLGLDPLTQPFEYLWLRKGGDRKALVLYAKRAAAEQLRRRHKISVQIVDRNQVKDVYIVVARATMPDGRTDEATGAVSIAGLSGDALANALMKAETKAKRRATLSIVGLGMLDETEIETIPHAQPASVEDTEPPPMPALETIQPVKIENSPLEQIKRIAADIADLGFGVEIEEGQHRLTDEVPPASAQEVLAGILSFVGRNGEVVQPEDPQSVSDKWAANALERARSLLEEAKRRTIPTPGEAEAAVDFLAEKIEGDDERAHLIEEVRYAFSILPKLSQTRGQTKGAQGKFAKAFANLKGKHLKEYTNEEMQQVVDWVKAREAYESLVYVDDKGVRHNFPVNREHYEAFTQEFGTDIWDKTIPADKVQEIIAWCERRIGNERESA